ncbi:extracellular matrix protein 2-like [Vulpes vulpes]|uniref:Extracellular matrix protein 2-like n=1 Tax=Vulpes vulpes TaxID=9627 RepID=A0ABM4ZAR5_VULVU
MFRALSRSPPPPRRHWPARLPIRRGPAARPPPRAPPRLPIGPLLHVRPGSAQEAGPGKGRGGAREGRGPRRCPRSAAPARRPQERALLPGPGSPRHRRAAWRPLPSDPSDRLPFHLGPSRSSSASVTKRARLRQGGIPGPPLTVVTRTQRPLVHVQLFSPSAGPGGLRGPSEVAMRSMMLPVLALWVGCCPGGALAEQGLSPREPAATPTSTGMLTLQPPPPSWPGPPNGQARPTLSNGGPDRPEEGAHEACTQPPGPSRKAPARPGPAQREASPPAAWDQEWSHYKGPSSKWARPQAVAEAQERAVATREGVLCRPGSGSRHQKKDDSQGQGGGCTKETTDRERERPRSRQGHGHRFPDLGAAEQAMPPLPASCLLARAAIACSNVKMKHIPALTDPGLATLYLAENEIAKIPVHAFRGLPNLQWLDLSKNKLDAQGLHPDAFKNLTRLKRLNLDGNSLAAVPALPASLQELKLNDNVLQGLQHSSFRGLSRLLTLEVEGNQLHDGNISPLAFQPLHSLLYLRLDRNHLRTIPPGLPASLRELHLGTNVFEEVTEGMLNHSHSLSVLVLSNKQLQEDRLAPRAWTDLPKLEVLDLSHNRLARVPSFLPRGLRRLTLHHNRIERIPAYVFAHMRPGLELLRLSHNSLRTDGIRGASFLGLRRSLAELLLDHNQLRAIPRGLLGLRGLQVLHLSHNKIRHMPLNSICDARVAQNSSLISTHLENNLIDPRRIPPTAFSCIRVYRSVVFRPQQQEGVAEGS